MIELCNISVRYKDKTVVKGVTTSAEAGEFIALVGPNGSGKSTLLKAVSGLLPHDGTTNLPAHRKARAASLAYLAQNATAPDRRIIREIVSLGRTPHIGALSRLSQTDEAHVSAAMEKCNIIEFAKRHYGELSGGEQTRVHLARALATDAPLLIADEPVTALDPYYQISVMNILRETASAKKIVIAALHDLALARRYCDRIWVMNKGQLVADGPPDTALTPDILRDVFRITPDGHITT